MTGPWLKSDRPVFKCCLCLLLTVWPWEDSFTSLSHSFLMCEMRMFPSSKSCQVKEMR